MMTAYVISVNPDTNKVTWHGVTSEFTVEDSGHSVSTSSMRLHKFKGKTDDIIAFMLINGHGNLKPDKRAYTQEFYSTKGPAYYYGVVTAVDEENDTVTVSSTRYYMNSTYTVEPGLSSFDPTNETDIKKDRPLNYLTNLVNRWMVLSPLNVQRLRTKKYTGKIENCRYPNPDNAGTANLNDTISEWFDNYGITYVTYGDMLRDASAPRSSNDNLLPTNQSSAREVVSGITFVSNGNGSYTVNGTLEKAVEAYYTIFNKAIGSTNLTIGSTYTIGLNSEDEEQSAVMLNAWAKANGNWVFLKSCWGGQNGEITIPSGTSHIWFRLRVAKERSRADNETVEPYIRIGNQNQPLFQATEGSSSVDRGITYINNKDGSYTLSGTVSSGATESLCTLYQADITGTDYIAGKEYSAGIMPYNPNVKINIWYNDGQSWGSVPLAHHAGTGDPNATTEYLKPNFTLPSNAKKIWIRIKVEPGTTLVQNSFKPYICMSSGSPYQLLYGAFISGDNVGTVIIDKSKYIKDPHVIVRPTMNGEPNGINICTIVSTDENEYASVNIDRRYMKTNGVIVATPDDPGIARPIKMTTYNYSPEIESKTDDKGNTTKTIKTKSADDVAYEQLKMPLYAHEISFSMSIYHPMINQLTKIGNLFNAFYKNKVYDTIVTEYKIDSTSDFVEIKAGTVNSKLEAIIHEAQATATNSNTSTGTTNNSTTTISSSGGSGGGGFTVSNTQTMENIVSTYFDDQTS